MILSIWRQKKQARLGCKHCQYQSHFLKGIGVFVVASIVVCLETSLIEAKTFSEKIEQKSQVSPQSSTDSVRQQAFIKTQKLEDEARQFLKQGTLEGQQKAVAKYEEILKIWREIGDRTQEASTLYQIGSAYRSVLYPYLQKLQKALAAFQKALTIQREQKDLNSQALTLKDIAKIYETLKQPQQELATYNQILTVYNQLLEIQQAKKDLAAQADTLREIAQIHEGGFWGEYSSLNQSEKALSIYQQLLEIQQKQKDLEGQIRTLSTIATIYQNLKASQKELAAYNQILVLHNQLLEIQQIKKDLAGQAHTLRDLAIIYDSGFYGRYSNLVQPQKALSIYQQILKIQQVQKDLEGQALTLQNIGYIYHAKLVQPKKALATYKQVLSIRQQQKDLYWQGITLDRIGDVYDSQKQEQQARISHTRAIDAYKQVLERLKTETKNPSGSQSSSFLVDRASILGKIAETYGKLGDASNTLYYEMQSSELRLAEDKDPEARVKKLYRMSDKYIRFGKRQNAINTLNRAIEIQQQNRDLAGQAETLRQIAGIYQSSSEPQKALNLYNQILATQQQIGNRTGQAKTLSDIAEVDRLLGAYTFSTDNYNQALVVAKQAGDFKQQVDILSDIGTVYRDEEQHDKALAFYLQALALNRSIKDDRRHEIYPGFKRELSESAVQLNLGLTYLELRDFPKALTAANRSLELSRKTGFFSGPAFAYTLIGRTYFKQGAYQKALNAYEKALPDFKKYQTPGMDAKVLNYIGETYVGLKQYGKAIEVYNSALVRMQQKWGNRQGEAKTRYLIAVAERDRGNLKAAQTQIEAALNVVEDYRSKVVDSQLRTSYFTSVQKYYEFYIDLLMQLHKQQPSKGFNALALQTSERARARSLLDLLNESQADIRQGVDPKLLEQEKNLQFQLDALEKRRIELYSKTPTKSQAANFEQEYNALSSQYQDIETQIRANSPRYAALTQPKPLTLTEIQQQVLDDKTVLLEYFLGEERSYLWVVGKSEITSYELPKESEIEAATQKFRKLVTNPKARASEISQAGTPLSQMLLSPVAKQLGQKRLLMVSNGALQYLPFAALPAPTGSQLLLSEHEIINLPSASTLATLRQELKGRKPAPKTVAVFADPVFSPTDGRLARSQSRTPTPNEPTQGNVNAESFSLQTLRSAAQDAGMNFERLPGTRQEAKDILQLLPANMQAQALDFEANKSNVLNSRLSQYRIVHFATHGILNTTRPELSAVVLSLVDPKGRPQNGFLRLNDIFNLNLPAELVVLSACQTGSGQNIRGEGLVGLTRGFMYAGTPRVLASLWSVDDESTAVLMTLFYKAMLEKGLPPAAALRTAQLELQKQLKWQSPYYWAAFTLQGEWR
jgi:CHAT domain-containing protein